MIDIEHDAVGHAFYDYYTQGKASVLLCKIKDIGDDIVPVGYYFRSYAEMPEIEKPHCQCVQGIF